MEKNTRNPNTNDYAVAKALNKKVSGIILQVFVGNGLDLAKHSDMEGLNRAYILLTHELEKIYVRNPELQTIKPGPIWRRFDMLMTSKWEIIDHVADTDDIGYVHNLHVEKLCIIAGIDEPVYTPEQQESVKSADVITSAHAKKVKHAIDSKKPR